MNDNKLGSFRFDKFHSDLRWNFVSFGVIAASGLLLNVLIAYFYTPEDLGVFNQSYAIFIVVTRFAVVGLPPSVLKYISEFSDDLTKCKGIILTALLLAVGLSTFVAMIVWFLRNQLGTLFDSSDVSIAVAWVAPAIIFFSLNKILLMAVNGFRRMRIFAFLQGLRLVLMAIALLVMIKMDWPSNQLSAIFIISEFVLFLFCISFLRKVLFVADLQLIKHWFNRHINFGLKSFVSEGLLDFNTRVDVLMLGYFVSDKIVGIYSFSALLAEGFGMTTAVFMHNSTPILVNLLTNKEFDKALDFIRNVKLLAYKMLIPLGLVLIITYNIWMKIITDNAELLKGWPIFSILTFSIVIAAGYMPFKKILQAAGRPGSHSIMIACTVMINVVLNILLIPHLGMIGAATATAVSNIAFIMIISFAIKRLCYS